MTLDNKVNIVHAGEIYCWFRDGILNVNDRFILLDDIKKCFKRNVIRFENKGYAYDIIKIEKELWIGKE